MGVPEDEPGRFEKSPSFELELRMWSRSLPTAQSKSAAIYKSITNNGLLLGLLALWHGK